MFQIQHGRLILLGTRNKYACGRYSNTRKKVLRTKRLILIIDKYYNVMSAGYYLNYTIKDFLVQAIAFTIHEWMLHWLRTPDKIGFPEDGAAVVLSLRRANRRLCILKSMKTVWSKWEVGNIKKSISISANTSKCYWRMEHFDIAVAGPEIGNDPSPVLSHQIS